MYFFCVLSVHCFFSVCPLLSIIMYARVADGGFAASVLLKGSSLEDCFPSLLSNGFQNGFMKCFGTPKIRVNVLNRAV